MTGRIFKMEIRKALRNKFFYISILIGCVITMFSLAYNIEIYQVDMANQTGTSNPMYGASNLFNRWIGGEPFSLGTAAYFFLFPLLVSVPYGWSYCEEKQSGYVRLVAVYSGKSRYFLSKYAAVWLSGGLAMIVPLIFNFSLSLLFFPVVMPDPVYCTSNGVFYGSFLSIIYYSNPFLYVFLYLCIDFIFAGLIACIGYVVSCFSRHRVAAMIMPMLLLLAVNYSRQFLYTSNGIFYKEISPLYFLRPVESWSSASGKVILIEMVILFAATFFLIMIWERKHEIY